MLFQFTPLREGRPRAHRPCRRCNYFNSRPSARGDENRVELGDIDVISIHAPPRGATCAVSMAAIFTCSISIHAPPRGATLKAVLKDATGQISIHAPPRGATCFTVHMETSGNFNSRPSARGDRLACLDELLSNISIHAPPRGATIAGRSALYHLINFNSRPSARGDLSIFRNS